MRTLFNALLMFTAIASSAEAATVAYYRFEDQSYPDSTGNKPNGSVFSSSTPNATIPLTGAPNKSSVTLSRNDSIAFNYAFPFDSLTNATLEFYVKPAAKDNMDVIWTTSSGGDFNRFNIQVLLNKFDVDYRSPNGALHLTIHGGIEVPVDTWTFLALVKSGDTYTTYVNGVKDREVTDINPNLPNGTGWTINGRGPLGGCCQYAGSIDEVRLSDVALTSSQFLGPPTPVVPLPPSLLLFGSGLVGLGLFRRRQR